MCIVFSEPQTQNLQTSLSTTNIIPQIHVVFPSVQLLTLKNNFTFKVFVPLHIIIILATGQSLGGDNLQTL